MTEAQRAAKKRLKHFEDFYDDKLDDIVNRRFGKPSYLEPFTDKFGKLKYRRPHELRSWADTVIMYESSFRSSGMWPNGKFEPGDARGISGFFKDKWVDWTGIPKEALPIFDHIGNPTRYVESMDLHKKAIDKHLRKIIKAPDNTDGLIDYYICEMKHFTQKMKDDIMEHLDSLTDPQLAAVRNSNKFIILNP